MKRTWLKQIRTMQQKTVNDVCHESGITQQFYNFIENGRRRPSPEVAKKIANFLGFDWKLFYEDNNYNKDNNYEKEEE